MCFVILSNLNSTAVLWIYSSKILHLDTYSCKYETAKYLMSFLGGYCLWNRVLGQQTVRETSLFCSLGVNPLIHQSELRTYTKVFCFKEKS